MVAPGNVPAPERKAEFLGGGRGQSTHPAQELLVFVRIHQAVRLSQASLELPPHSSVLSRSPLRTCKKTDRS